MPQDAHRGDRRKDEKSQVEFEKRLNEAGPKENRGPPNSQWLFLVPLKGGIGGIYSPNWQYIPLVYYTNYTTYSPCLLGGYMLPYATYHLLGAPETTIEIAVAHSCLYGTPNWAGVVAYIERLFSPKKSTAERQHFALCLAKPYPLHSGGRGPERAPNFQSFSSRL